MIKHPLQNSWTLWFFKNDKTKQWEENQREIITFNTVIFLKKLTWKNWLSQPGPESQESNPKYKERGGNLASGQSVKSFLWATHPTLGAERGPTENKTLHGQDFCNKLRTSWSVTLQNSWRFVYTIRLNLNCTPKTPIIVWCNRLDCVQLVTEILAVQSFVFSCNTISYKWA